MSLWMLGAYIALAVLSVCQPSCSPPKYRRSADRESYGIIDEKMNNPNWKIPRVDITPPPQSRLHDPYDPDYPPLPPDDPAAHRYMHCVDGIRGYKGWHKDGDAPSIEDPRWQDYLQLSPNGSLLLSPDNAVQLGLLHSRDYQTNLERLYLSALALTLERFEFDVKWFAGNSTAYRHFGTSSTDDPKTLKIEGNESNTLTTTSSFGFSRAFATGGQLVVDFANAFVWEFTGPDHSSATSNIGINLVQPLLRRAGREVRLEALTQSERAVLYAVRDFARYRKEFFVGITVGNDDIVGFLSLLLQLQGIRNNEANLVSLEQNLRLHEALSEAGIVSRIQVDQVFQSYQKGRFDLIRAQAVFETSLDDYKLSLGLPPGLPIDLDDSLLNPFQLNDPAITRLERDVDELLAEYRVLEEAPPVSQLREGIGKLRPFHGQLVELIVAVVAELARWETQIPAAGQGEEGIRVARERAAYQQLSERMAEVGRDADSLRGAIDEAANRLDEATRTESWEALQKLARRELTLVADLYVIQTQIRAYLIKLRPVEYQQQPAIQFALENRLDLMNQRARVVDAWRKITVAADGLESDLDVFFNADIATKPDGDNPVKFSAAANTYQVGFRFDGPLNRLAERNIYRAALVNYQRSRRAYMALEDGIGQAVRRDLRVLNTERLNFEIARQRLIAAARQVELARDQLLAPGPAGDSSTTQDVLNALSSLLEAKNSLIGSWVAYETGRMQLLLDLEAMQLDERGVYTDEQHSTTERTGSSEPRVAPAVIRPASEESSAAHASPPNEWIPPRP